MITERIVLNIEGMTCDGCSQTLKRESGVHDADVSFEAGSAVVAHDPNRTGEEGILNGPHLPPSVQRGITVPALRAANAIVSRPLPPRSERTN